MIPRSAKAWSSNQGTCVFKNDRRDIGIAIAAFDGFAAVEVDLLVICSEIHLAEKRHLVTFIAIREMKRSVRRIRAKAVDAAGIFKMRHAARENFLTGC